MLPIPRICILLVKGSSVACPGGSIGFEVKLAIVWWGSPGDHQDLEGEYIEKDFVLPMRYSLCGRTIRRGEPLIEVPA